MTGKPWESEPDRLEFEADGLPCVMQRNPLGAWCGYVGVDANHPLYGLPTNHPLKLPVSWFEGRRGLEGTGPLDVFIHMLGDKKIDEACAICLALQVHGGVNWADHHVPSREPDERWWFGFDCSHAGDIVPNVDRSPFLDEMIDNMPKETRDLMRDIVHREQRESVYRDQQYVVGECQSLAAQLVRIVEVLEKARVQT